MKWLKQLFINRKNRTSTPPIPPIEEIANTLYGKQLSNFIDAEVVKVIYSVNKTKRFIILKSLKGFYKYTYEEIYVYDEDEWTCCCNDENAYPACWISKDKSSIFSFFGTEGEVLAVIMSESEYILYFK